MHACAHTPHTHTHARAHMHTHHTYKHTRGGQYPSDIVMMRLRVMSFALKPYTSRLLIFSIVDVQ